MTVLNCKDHSSAMANPAGQDLKACSQFIPLHACREFFFQRRHEFEWNIKQVTWMPLMIEYPAGLQRIGTLKLNVDNFPHRCGIDFRRKFRFVIVRPHIKQTEIDQH